MSAIHLSQREAARAGLAKRSKYGVRTDTAGKAARTVDGITFASLREAQRYGDLKLLEKAGAIKCLRLQPRFPLDVNGHRICAYVGDFAYIDDSLAVVEDVKSAATRTAVYRLKKKLMQAIYGITIREV